MAAYLRRRLLRGDLGVSWIRGQPVSEIISDRLWLTMTLSLAAILLGICRLS